MITNFDQAIKERAENRLRKIPSKQDIINKRREYVEFLNKQVENINTVRHNERNERHPLEIPVDGRRKNGQTHFFYWLLNFVCYLFCFVFIRW